MNVTKINYKNNEYSLDGVSLEQALELLHIDKDSVTMETEGDTLYIMAKAGSKGVISLADMKRELEKAQSTISLASLKEENKSEDAQEVVRSKPRATNEDPIATFLSLIDKEYKSDLIELTVDETDFESYQPEISISNEDLNRMRELVGELHSILNL